MKYIAQSTAVWDAICRPDQTDVINAPGGAGFYALAGMKVWEDDVGLVTGIGADYLERFGSWYRTNRISTSGMIVRDAHTPRTIIRYREDGERLEEPAYGQDHYRKMEVTPVFLRPFGEKVCGVYVFKNIDMSYWKLFFDVKQTYGFAAMWEIAADAALPENRERVQQIAERLDILSINRTEALRLLGKTDLSDVVDIFRTWDVPLIYLRLGSKGVYLIGRGRGVYVPSLPGVAVVDPTGGGNSSSGGALVGYCRGCSLEEIGAMGNVSASFCIAQWGVPKFFDDDLHKEAEKRKRRVLSSCNAE